MKAKLLTCICATFMVILKAAAQHNTELPSARSGYCMVYDAHRGVVVLFGGQDSASVKLGDTWEWKNGAWVKKDITGPAARINACMVYDAGKKNVILFGGYSTDGAVNDLWQYDGIQWKKMATSTSPDARQMATMCYDKKNDQFVLFGGFSAKRAALGDTWILKNGTWTQLNIQGPGARASHAMVYDDNMQCVFVYGGYTDGALKDFWQLKKGEWHNMGTETGPARLHTSLVYDRKNKRLLMFGGFNEFVRTNELWEFANDKWRPIPIEKEAWPAPRAEHRGVFVPGKGFFVFGGVVGPDPNTRNRANDTWIYHKNKWVKIG
jgi:hypothetical protein